MLLGLGLFVLMRKGSYMIHIEWVGVLSPPLDCVRLGAVKVLKQGMCVILRLFTGNVPCILPLPFL